MTKYRAVNFTGSYFANGTSEIGSYCCGIEHDTLAEAIICFEDQGEHAFGSGLHGGGHGFFAIDGEEYRYVTEDSNEYAEGFDEASRLRNTCSTNDENVRGVPPNRTFQVKTRYVYEGKGLPRPFDVDD